MRFTMRILRSFRERNPVGLGVNWAVALEPAMRLLSLVHIRDLVEDALSPEETSWLNEMIAEHLLFVLALVEYGSIRGNHYVADVAAVLVGAAAFEKRRWRLRSSRSPSARSSRRFQSSSGSDGVQYEASTAYHRFVVELAFIGFRAAEIAGRTPSPASLSRLQAAARYSLAYTRRDGSSPLHGDSDGARAIVVLIASAADHRYLANLVEGLDGSFALPPHESGVEAMPASRSGGDGAGCACIGGERRRTTVHPIRCERLFRDPQRRLRLRVRRRLTVGLAGRGGHGHNDCLSFELVLGGVWLIAEGAARRIPPTRAAATSSGAPPFTTRRSFEASNRTS